MRRCVLPLGLLVAVAAVAAASAGCSNPNSGVAVSVVTPTQTPSPVPTPTPLPTPTSTPIPPPSLTLSTNRVYQAGAILASVSGDVAAGSITFIGRTFPLTRDSTGMYAFLAVDAADATGVHSVSAAVTTSAGAAATLTQSVTVLRTTWDVSVDNLTFSPTTAKLLDPKLVQAEEATLHAVYGKVTPEKLWSGAWQMPVSGPITAHFGEQRSYQGGPPTGHHSGTDIGVDEGTPIHAANSGRVVLAQMLSERGNMVIIDHGGGLFSGYAHMSAFKVTVGEMVQKGQVIGLAGSTGLATGPHVHWEMSANGILLDALRFTDGSDGF